jgi:hypothetical protein
MAVVGGPGKDRERIWEKKPCCHEGVRWYHRLSSKNLTLSLSNAVRGSRKNHVRVVPVEVRLSESHIRGRYDMQTLPDVFECWPNHGNNALYSLVDDGGSNRTRL